MPTWWAQTRDVAGLMTSIFRQHSTAHLDGRKRAAIIVSWYLTTTRNNNNKKKIAWRHDGSHVTSATHTDTHGDTLRERERERERERRARRRVDGRVRVTGRDGNSAKVSQNCAIHHQIAE